MTFEAWRVVGFHVLFCMEYYHETHSEALSFVVLQPLGYAFLSSTVNAGPNDLELTRCVLPLVLLPLHLSLIRGSSSF